MGEFAIKASSVTSLLLEVQAEDEASLELVSSSLVQTRNPSRDRSSPRQLDSVQLLSSGALPVGAEAQGLSVDSEQVVV